MQDAVTTLPAREAPGATPSRATQRWRAVGRNIFPFIVIGVLWQIVAMAGLFPPRLFPPLQAVAYSFYDLTVSGILPHHAIETLIRLLSGFALAAVFGLLLLPVRLEAAWQNPEKSQSHHASVAS